MKNKEIEELLNKLKKCRDYDDEVLLIKQYGATLLLSYIEQLEKENKILRENAEHNDKVVDKVNWENKQLENNRDKSIEICDFYNKKYQKDPLGNQKVLFVISNVMNILKGDNDASTN